jgi:hypothetical protein
MTFKTTIAQAHSPLTTFWLGARPADMCSAWKALLVAGPLALQMGGAIAAEKPAPNTASQFQACMALQGQRIAGAVLETATLVPATAQATEHCHVTGAIETALKFEIRLPTRWNHKLLYTGGGGFDGYIDLPYNSASSLIDGYVQVASNGGHLSTAEPGWEWTDAKPFFKNPRAQLMFASTSVHTVLQVAKAIVHKRYGSLPTKRYFEGCSNGGREGLVSATRFPHDFDGVVVHAPGWNITKLSLAGNAISKRLAEHPLSEAKAQAIADAVLSKCDGLDGIQDGVVHNVAACQFDPSEMACPVGADAASCLTTEEVKTEQVRMAPLAFANGELIYPGWAPGSEYKNPSGLPDANYVDYAFMWRTEATKPGALELIADGFIRYWLTGTPDLDTRTFDLEKHKEVIDAASTMLDAEPNLATFFAVGGKLILIHGTDDNTISYRSSIDYFNAVAAASGGAEARDKSMEFFLAPGVMHCMGGNGPDKVDLARAIDGWVGKGRRPSEAGLTLERQDIDGHTQLSRPLCRYPTFARYKRSGDTHTASSYTCAAP